MLSLCSLAHADVPVSSSGSPDMVVQLVMLAGFVVVFWLLIWRPQSKRSKEHKNLLTTLGKGDEVVTTGGIVGKVTNVTDDFLTLEVADNIMLNFQKSSISAALPKGTVKAIK